jgi:hypothetical protein
MTLIKMGRRVMNLGGVTEIILERPGSMGPGHPACVAFVGGHTVELVGAEADQLRARFDRHTPAAFERVEAAEHVQVSVPEGRKAGHPRVPDTLVSDLS